MKAAAIIFMSAHGTRMEASSPKKVSLAHVQSPASASGITQHQSIQQAHITDFLTPTVCQGLGAL